MLVSGLARNEMGAEKHGIKLKKEIRDSLTRLLYRHVNMFFRRLHRKLHTNIICWMQLVLVPKLRFWVCCVIGDEEWWTRHSRDKKKEKGDVGAEVGEKLKSFFCTAHEFLTDFTKCSNPPVPAVIPVNAFVPVNAFIPVVFVPTSSPNHCIISR